MLLEPYRVLDLTDERGLLCGQVLADLGADVVAVEPPGGSPARRLGPFLDDRPDPEGSLWWWSFARNKRGITLDLESDAGRDQFLRLAEVADFVIESFAPGYLDGIGLGYEALRQRNPRLILVSISPFGQSGPKAHWAATDLTALASSHALLLSGDADRPPVRITVPQAFLHAGADAAVGALVALFARERDGLGQHVDVSTQTAAMMAAQSAHLTHGWGSPPFVRMAGGVATGPFRIRFVQACRDGFVSVTFLFGSGLGLFAKRLMEVMCEDGFVDEATRDKDWEAFGINVMLGKETVAELQRCVELIGAWTAGRTKRELFDLAMRRSLLIVPVNTTADLLDSAQLAARDYWTQVAHPALGRSITYPGPFAKFSATPIRYTRPAPRVGEHNDEVRGQWSAAREPEAGSVQPPQDSATAPLAGVKVLDFTWVFAGPMGTRPLVDYGATVVHVESGKRVDALRTNVPFKDGMPGPERGGGYCQVTAGKLGLMLNLGCPEGRQVALKLAAWADVVVENYSPKAMRAWGLGYDDLRAVNPSVIMVSTCLNGQNGPEAGLAGYGTMGSQIAGFGYLAGWPDRPPAGPFLAYTDYTSAHAIPAAVLAALDHRRRTGQGQYIDLAQSESGIHYLGPAVLDYTVNGRVDERAGNTSSIYAPHGVYPALGEDRWVAIACRDDGDWQRLCDASGHGGWAQDPRFASFEERRRHHEALDAAIGTWTAVQDVEAIETLLQAVNVPVHRCSSSADLFADPQLQHRNFFPMVEHPEVGPVPIDNSHFVLSRTPAQVNRPGPTFGQHNEQVLREILGLDDEALVELAIAGALE